MGCVFMKPFYRQVKTFQSEKELAEEGCISDLQILSGMKKMNSKWLFILFQRKTQAA